MKDIVQVTVADLELGGLKWIRIDNGIPGHQLVLPGTEHFGLSLQMPLWVVVRGGDSWASPRDSPSSRAEWLPRHLRGQWHPADCSSYEEGHLKYLLDKIQRVNNSVSDMTNSYSFLLEVGGCALKTCHL